MPPYTKGEKSMNMSIVRFDPYAYLALPHNDLFVVGLG